MSDLTFSAHFLYHRSIMNKKILIVDDDLFIREIYIDVLKQSNFEVDSATNGEEGFEKIKNGGYSLILLDCHMPKMSGIDVLNKLSDNPPKIQNGPIIILTNSEPEEVLEECMKKGANSYFTKSELTPQELITNVKKILDH